MIRVLFIVIGLSVSLSSFSQQIDQQFYLFGFSFDYTVTTYRHRKQVRKKFNPWIPVSDTKTIARLSEVTDLTPVKTCPNSNKLHGFKKSKPRYRLDHFYRFSYEREGFRNVKATGTLRDEPINRANESQKLSYLAGAYLKYGTMHHDTVRFQFGMVNMKLELTQSFIESLGQFTYMEVVLQEKGTLGGGPMIAFIPTGSLKKAILKEESYLTGE